MQQFDDSNRQAFYDFWKEMTQRCVTVEYVETKLGKNGKQIGRKLKRKVRLQQAWIRPEVHSTTDNQHYAAIGFGDSKIHIGLGRFGHLTGPGPFVLSKSNTTVQVEIEEWVTHFRCEGEDFTIEASISFS
jgi:hypothetical protein